MAGRGTSSGMGRRLMLGGRCGFTLIELLVVVSIIAVLMALLLPALAKARVAAQKVQCASNQRGLGQAMQSYAAEFKGYLAPPQPLSGNPFSGYAPLWGGLTNPVMAPTWSDGVLWMPEYYVHMQYMPNKAGLWKCPLSPPVTGYFGGWGRIASSYTFGNLLVGSYLDGTVRTNWSGPYKSHELNSRHLVAGDGNVGWYSGPGAWRASAQIFGRDAFDTWGRIFWFGLTLPDNGGTLVLASGQEGTYYHNSPVAVFADGHAQATQPPPWTYPGTGNTAFAKMITFNGQTHP